MVWQPQQHPRQWRWPRQPRPPRTLLFPGVKGAFPPFHLKRTIAGKSFAFGTPWEDGPRAKKSPLPTSSGIWTLERLQTAWGCKRGARRPGAQELRARAGASCSCSRCCCCCCCCARAPAGLQPRAKRRRPSCICGRLVSGTEFPFFLLHIGVHVRKVLGFRGTPLCFSMPPVCWDPKVKSTMLGKQIRSRPMLFGKKQLTTQEAFVSHRNAISLAALQLTSSTDAALSG